MKKPGLTRKEAAALMTSLGLKTSVSLLNTQAVYGSGPKHKSHGRGAPTIYQLEDVEAYVAAKLAVQKKGRR